MGAEGNTPSFGLLVTSGPYRSRESRAEIDLALAALTLDYRLEIYFSGDAVLQLAEPRDSAEAQLPAGYRAWSALPDLGDVQLFAESGWLSRCERRGIRLCLPVEGLGHTRMKRHWRECDRVLVL